MNNLIKSQLTELLTKAHAHATLDQSLKNMSIEDTGMKPGNLTYSMKLAEHIRITQWDTPEFSRDPNHQSPDWPDGYWPVEDAPADENEWDKWVAAN